MIVKRAASYNTLQSLETLLLEVETRMTLERTSRKCRLQEVGDGKWMADLHLFVNYVTPTMSVYLLTVLNSAYLLVQCAQAGADDIRIVTNGDHLITDDDT